MVMNMPERLKMPLIVAGVVFVVFMIISYLASLKKGDYDFKTSLLASAILAVGVFIYGLFS